MFTDAAMFQAEREHCLRLVGAGAGWDSFTLAKVRELEKRRTYRGLVGVVEKAIVESGRKLPAPWAEPAGVEVFTIPANYRMATHVEKVKR